MEKPNCGQQAAFLHNSNSCRQAYLLAGGESLRMGRDKLFLPINGRSLLEQVHTVLSERFESVKLAARSHSKFAGLPYPVIIDSPRAKGPMAGLIAALEDSAEPICFVCAVDLPDISAGLIDRLLKAYNGEDYLGVEESNRNGEGRPKAIQPLCGIWSKKALESIYQLSEAGNYRLSDLVNQVRSASLPHLSDRWRNLNSPADIDQPGVQHG